MMEAAGARLSTFLDPRLLVPPRVEPLLPRPTLLETQGRIPLVVAPAGYGKSSLLAQWAAAQDSARWLTLPPAADQPDFLLAALSAVVRLPEPPNRLTPELLEALVAHPLVLDDCHHISHPDACKTLDAVVDAFPAERLALGSRTQPEWPALGRRRVRRELSEIGPKQLAFRGEALARFTEDSLALSLDAATRDVLERATDGWAALVVLAALWLEDVPAPRRADALSRILAQGNPALYDYLAAEVLATLPDPLREFVLHAAVAPCLRPAPGQEALLRDLERRRLLLPLPDGSAFHQLFLDFLRTRQQERLGPEGYRLHADERASSLWERGFHDDALSIWEESKLFAPMAARLNGAIGDDPLPLRRWILAMPEEALLPYPSLLCLAGAWRGDAHDFPRAERLLNIVEESAPPELAKEASLRLVRIARYKGEGKEIERRLKVLAASPPEAPAWRIYLAQEQAFQSLFYYQDFAAAAGFLDAVQAQLPHATLPRPLRASILVQQATMRDRWRGDFKRIVDVADELHALYDSKPPLAIQAFIECLRAEAAFQTDAPGGGKLFESFFRTAEMAESVGLRFAAERYIAVWQSRFGDLDRVDPSLRMPQHEGDMACFLPLARAWVAARRGDREGARAAAEETAGFPLVSVEGGERWRLAEPLLHVRDTEGALRFCRLAGASAERAALPFDQAMALFWESAAAPCRETLAECLRVTLFHGFSEYLLRQSAAPAVLTNALALGVEPERTRELLERLGEVTAYIRTFGELEVVWNGKTVAWPRPKARALFAYLLLAGGRPVPIERAVDALWPDADLEKGRQSYRTHCSYLRQALGSDCLETTHESVRLVLPKATLDQRAQLRRAHASTSPELWEAALQSVGDGEFLPEFLYDDWSAPERDTLHRLRDELGERLITIR